jgi:hypothetical protein
VVEVTLKLNQPRQMTGFCFVYTSCFSFSLDGKRNKKIKAKPNAPPVLPANAHEECFYLIRTSLLK